MRIALLPLDERPVNTVYPRMIAEIAGVEVILPPSHLLSVLRTPAHSTDLGTWLQTQAETCDAVIVSIEMLAYGGLIASRISHETTPEILARLAVLQQIKAMHPALPVYGFNVITRISNADNNIEEPLYWDRHGTQLYRYSQLMHRQQQGQDVGAEVEALKRTLTPQHVLDFTRRRLRNHLVNLHVLELLADGVFDLLVLSSDDTSEYGFGSQEKAWLKTWTQRLPHLEPRLLMYPGADEVGSVLLMRAINAASAGPSFSVHYAVEEDREVIAPYEDSPIQWTLERQIRALGGVQEDDYLSTDFIVAVNTPSRLRTEYDPAHPAFAAEQERRAPFLRDFVVQIGQWLDQGRRVILVDVAYPNGSDPDLMRLLLAQINVSQLAAYGAWNTAGNTIGVALAQGAASLHISTERQMQAQKRFLLHRFLEDWGYQQVVRQQVRDWLAASTRTLEITPETEADACAMIARELSALMPSLGSLSQGWTPGDVRLPWHRTFEVDFDLVPIKETGKPDE
jgi:hypothetical protein